jgi:hypothetical protein
VFSALYLTSLTLHRRSITLTCGVQDVIKLVIVVTNFTGFVVQSSALRSKSVFTYKKIVPLPEFYSLLFISVDVSKDPL